MVGTCLIYININRSLTIQYILYFAIEPEQSSLIKSPFVETMFSAKLVCITIAVCLSAFNFGCAWENSGDSMPSPTSCFNCTICQYPCNPLSPPASGNPSYGAPLPPPPPPPALPGYPAYVPPPPPAQGKCPPTPIQCCQYPPPPPSGVYVPISHALPCSVLNFPYVVVMHLFASALSF